MTHFSFAQTSPDTLMKTVVPDSLRTATDTLGTDTLNVKLSDDLKSKVHYLADDSIILMWLKKRYIYLVMRKLNMKI
ncbi:MAG: hypothetical protein IPJ79_11270 [Bacteroidetes bacterium]|nr:hypothetical protein [Bacteroidota bacterium]